MIPAAVFDPIEGTVGTGESGFPMLVESGWRKKRRSDGDAEVEGDSTRGVHGSLPKLILDAVAD